MGNRISKVYTRTGDDGSTGLSDGTRVSKAALRIAAIGDVDELNRLIGLLLCSELDDPLRELLLDVQHALFDIGGELSLPGEAMVRDAYATNLESWIDRINAYEQEVLSGRL